MSRFHRKFHFTALTIIKRVKGFELRKLARLYIYVIMYTFCVQIVVRDVNNSAYYSTAVLQVNVREGPPSPPRFTDTSITLRVLENATLGTQVGSLAGRVFDGRGRAVTASFSLVGFINNSCVPFRSLYSTFNQRFVPYVCMFVCTRIVGSL